MKAETLQDLFVGEIKDLYSAENQILKALPKMAETASSPDLKAGFEKHLRQTEQHVSRLEQICQELGESPRGSKCEGMEGLLEEGKSMMEDAKTPEALDAGM